METPREALQVAAMLRQDIPGGALEVAAMLSQAFNANDVANATAGSSTHPLPFDSVKDGLPKDSNAAIHRSPIPLPTFVDNVIDTNSVIGGHI